MVVQSDQPKLCIMTPPHSRMAEIEILTELALNRGWCVSELADGHHPDPEVDATCCLLVVIDPPGKQNLRQRFPHGLLVMMEGGRPDARSDIDLVLTAPFSNSALEQLLHHGLEVWTRNQKLMSLHRDVGLGSARTRQLADIGLALSSRMELNELLEAILFEARKLATCDAGSLYLVDDDPALSDEPCLVFKLAQNDSVDVPFVETRLPLTHRSLAGYVAISGKELNIPDAHDLPQDVPYEFNESFDEQMGYRTRSMLVLPMRDHHDQVVGVLQFINRIEPTSSDPLPFDEELSELLRAVASQAAITIQKNILLRDVSQLFESFVQASVKTIEQRDPTTSGHSLRVAETTIALLEALPSSGISRFGALSLTPEHLREVRYAALLHDFGKVGVKEAVLLKANKLPDERLELIRYRVELAKERLRGRALERELELLHSPDLDADVARRRVHRELRGDLGQLDDFYDVVKRANQPNLMEAGEFDHLREIRDYGFREFDGTLDGLLTDNDLLALSTRRGSLTPDERREIQTHVVHTRDFLSVLPWPPELARVPEIASAHHERLNGTGYPRGLVGEQIPLASRVMMVCDVYDALTAMDRPYKRAIPPKEAFQILEEEARLGLLDKDMVNVFIASRIGERVGSSRPPHAVGYRSQFSRTEISTRSS